MLLIHFCSKAGASYAFFYLEYSSLKNKMSVTLILVLLAQSNLQTYAGEPKTTSAQAALKQQILNGICCVPNLSSGHHPAKLKAGELKSGEETVSLGSVIFGRLANKPVAVAVMSNCTGGSGVLNSLLFYEQQGDKMVL